MGMVNGGHLKRVIRVTGRRTREKGKGCRVGRMVGHMMGNGCQI